MAPPSLRKVGQMAFCRCTQLKHFQLNEGIREPGWLCLLGTNVSELRLPTHAQRTPEYFGIGQGELETLRVPDGLEEVDAGLFQKSRLKKLVISSSVRTLGRAAFSGCERLCEVVFQPGSRLERIGEYCFAGCSLRQLVVPRSVRQIGDFAFCECRDLCRVDLEPDSLLAYVGEFAFWLTSMDLQNIRRVTPGDQRQL